MTGIQKLINKKDFPQLGMKIWHRLQDGNLRDNHDSSSHRRIPLVWLFELESSLPTNNHPKNSYTSCDIIPQIRERRKLRGWKI
jgi:hypothetical protein